MNPLALLRSVAGQESGSTGSGSSSGRSTGPRRICSNPLDRLCEKLLDANPLDTLIARSNPSSSVGKASTCRPAPSAQLATTTPLPITYESFHEYARAWEPLLVEEIRESLLSGFAGKASSGAIVEGVAQFAVPEVTTANMCTVEIAFMPLSMGNKSTSAGEQSGLPSLYDMLIFTPQRIKTPQNLSSPWEAQQSFAGIVVNISFQQKHKVFHVCFRSRHWLTLKHSGQAKEMTEWTREWMPAEGKKTYKVFATVADSLRSSWREFQALHDLGENVPLLPQILASDRRISSQQSSSKSVPPTQAEVSAPATHTALSHTASEAEVDSMRRIPGVTKIFLQRLQTQFNASQLHAIYAAATKPGFTLIQGPPGTGKTSTIIGILNSLHTREYNRYYAHLIATFLGPEGLQLRQKLTLVASQMSAERLWLDLLAKAVRVKPHILVVAPSNVAVDHIAERIMKSGFFDGLGGSYRPKLVRVGGGRTSSVVPIALEELVQRALFADLATLSQRERYVTELDRKVTETIKRLYHLQTLLFNLMMAFAQCNPLPEHWELRVNPADAQPYWVNHDAQKTSTQPPLHLVEKERIREEVSRENVRWAYRTAEALPEYGIYTHELTQQLNRLDEYNVLRSRLREVLTMNVRNYSGGGGGNVRGEGREKDLSSDTDTQIKHETSSSKERRDSRTANKDAVVGSSSSNNSVSTKKPNPYTVSNLSAATRDMLESSIINGAEILFATLNSCGHPSMEQTEFCVTLVDEAAQCVEPSVLIALRRGCQQCVMVGDENQLTATVFSDHAKQRGYDISLFERLIRSGHESIMLDTQYRMVPEISAFPSRMFYNNLLQDGENVKKEDYLPQYLRRNHDEIVFSTSNNQQQCVAEYRCSSSSAGNDNVYALLQPFMFFDLKSSRDQSGNTLSKLNVEEAQFCVKLLGMIYREGKKAQERERALAEAAQAAEAAANARQIRDPRLVIKEEKERNKIKSVSSSSSTSSSSSDDQSISSRVLGSIGVITPYSEQLSLLQREFRKAGLLGSSPGRQSPMALDIELNTVDGFQGKEKDIIIISTVRANDERTIGFLSDVRRMNVAITRARFGLFVVGNSATLENNRYWRELLRHAFARQVLLQVPSSRVNLPQLVFQHQTQKGLVVRDFVSTTPAPSLSPPPPPPSHHSLHANKRPRFPTNNQQIVPPTKRVKVVLKELEDGELEDGEVEDGEVINV